MRVKDIFGFDLFALRNGEMTESTYRVLAEVNNEH